jgi:cytochrome c553
MAGLGLAACGSSSSTTPDGGDGPGGDGGLTAQQARGQYIVDVLAVCGDCHTPRLPSGAPDMTKYLAGNAEFIVTPGGNLGSRNLTNDETGLKSRTNAEIKDMFQKGERPGATKEFLNPVMPYYVLHNMTDADADAVVAYLRTVPAVVNMIPKRAATFDVPAAAPPLPESKIPTPADTFAEKASALRGRYLSSQVGACLECHTQHTQPGSATVLDETKIFAGGEDFSMLFGGALKPVSKNLTSHATGLADWTVADIVKALKEGKAKDGTGICPPMPVGPMGAYGHLKDEDATDIANYIKSLAPIDNKIVDMCVFPPPAPMDGGTDGGGDASDASSDAAAAETSTDAPAAETSGDAPAAETSTVDGGADAAAEAG